MKARLSSLAISFLAFATVLRAEDTPANRTLARLRGLAGEWQGTLVWSGGRTGTGTLRAVYRLTGNGSAVVEDLVMDGETVPSMTSVYHVDGSDLRMTHYCGARNQPRLKASRIDEAAGVVHFAFVDATDLAAHPAHVEAAEVRFLPGDRLVIEFTFDAGGKKSLEHIELTRIPAS